MATHPAAKPTHTPETALASSLEPIVQDQIKNIYVDNPNYAIFTLDPSGKITSWNNGAVRMKRYKVEEAVGRNFSMLYTEEERRLHKPEEHLRDAVVKGTYRGVGVRVRKGGQHFLADVQITPMYKDGNLIGYSKIVSDVTLQGNLKRERDESRAQVDDLTIQKDLRERFVLTLTHDLRNPLATIKTSSQLILKNVDNPSMQERLVSMTLRGVERMERMITDLLDANRIAAGERLALKGEDFDLIDLLQHTVAELALSNGNQVQIHGPKHLYGYWDQYAIRRAFENLVINAFKYGDPLKPITVTVQPHDEQVDLTVHNWGEPISHENLKTIFTQFKRTRSAADSDNKGWGIGLTLVKGIIESHFGKIRIESALEQGTTFMVELPRDYRLRLQS